MHGCVHTDIHVCHHDLGWGATPNMHWRVVRNVVNAVFDALAHAVWPRGNELTDELGG